VKSVELCNTALCVEQSIAIAVTAQANVTEPNLKVVCEISHAINSLNHTSPYDLIVKLYPSPLTFLGTFSKKF
jgi:hypothetical protein